MLTDVSSRQTVVQHLGESGHEASQEKTKGRQRQRKNSRKPCHIISQNNIITIRGLERDMVQTILNACKASKGRTDNLHNSNKSLKRESKN